MDCTYGFYACFSQCRCIFRDQLHLARLEDLLQRLLECAIDLICELRVPAVEDGKKSIPETDDEAERTTDVDPKGTWTQPEKERLFLAVGKIFQLPFPFYQVRKIHLLRQVCALRRSVDQPGRRKNFINMWFLRKFMPVRPTGVKSTWTCHVPLCTRTLPI